MNETLREMALDPRLMPALASEQSSSAAALSALPPDLRAVRSSASTPSLRSRDGTLPMLARMDGGGNVRVVVRVRAFLQRGEFALPQRQVVLDNVNKTAD